MQWRSICIEFDFNSLTNQFYYDDVWVFDVKTETFHQMQTTGEKPPGRAQHTAVLVDNYLMYIFGGCDATTAFNDTYLLNLQNAQWRKVDAKGDLPPSSSLESQKFRVSGMKRPGVLVGKFCLFFPSKDLGEKVFFVGGPSKTKKSHSDDMYVFDLETSTWTQIFPKTKPPVIGFHTLCLVSDCHKAVVFGGTGPGMTADSNTYVADLDLASLCRPAIPPSIFLQDFGGLLFQQRFSDFVFHVKDPQGQHKVIPAHKNILYARCNYFRALFDSNMKEAKEGSMTIEDVSPESFAEVLRYLYTDQANVNPANATEVIILANRYGLERLERICESVIMDALDDNSVCQILVGAESASLDQLKKMCRVYILARFTEVIKTPQYQELSAELRKELEFKYVSQSSSRTNPFKFHL